jgi:hypothetical protein
MLLFYDLKHLEPVVRSSHVKSQVVLKIWLHNMENTRLLLNCGIYNCYSVIY